MSLGPEINKQQGWWDARLVEFWRRSVAGEVRGLELTIQPSPDEPASPSGHYGYSPTTPPRPPLCLPRHPC